MKNWPKKIVALAFIALIILGNIWLVSLFTHAESPAWTAIGFYICIVVVAVGGVGMLVERLIYPPTDE